ncbi:uncharacterized protein LOC130048337 isoform X2 [Ostrea edulis]|uniref:uncharacterized protein LOC130048337 isoform X2 n=1 Tax=Ostrea edulis TaxID=37623 RepID=UPI0024AEEEFE|nr:uncharacterized protein LOC130048337 isoform X2 [Ostrea edulis]
MMFNTAAVTIEKTVWRIIILFICARTTFGDSYFRIHFQSFGNTRNLMRTPSDNITCCRTQCLLPCSGYLTVSLSGAFGEITRDCFRIGTSSTISFGDRVGNANNPVVFRFQAPDLSKNISLSIKIRSDHDSNFTIYRHKFSFMLLVLGNIRSPTSFSSRDASTNSSLNFSVDFVNCKGNKSLHLFCNDKGERVCEKNYYGEHCREHCIVTTITRGHCNQLGKLVCENGSKIRIELTYRNLTHTPFPVLHLLLNIQNFLRDTICSETNVIDVDECLDKSADNRTLYIQAKCGDRCVTDHEIYSQLNSLTDENFKHRFPILQRTTPRSPSAKDEDSNWFSVHWQWMLGASLCLFVIILGCIIIMHHRQRKSEIQGRDSSEEDIREMSTFDPYLNPIYSLND